MHESYVFIVNARKIEFVCTVPDCSNPQNSPQPGETQSMHKLFEERSALPIVVQWLCNTTCRMHFPCTANKMQTNRGCRNAHIPHVCIKIVKLISSGIYRSIHIYFIQFSPSLPYNRACLYTYFVIRLQSTSIFFASKTRREKKRNNKMHMCVCKCQH